MVIYKNIFQSLGIGGKVSFFKFSLLLEVESCEMFHLLTRIIYVVILTFDENETDVLSLKIEFDMCTNI